MVQCTAFQAACRCIEFIATPKLSPTYCGWKKSCTTLDGWNPINNGINHVSTGAGFLPSTVCSWERAQAPTNCYLIRWSDFGPTPDWIFTRFGREPSYHLDFNQKPVRKTGTWNTKESIGESTCESICTTTSPTASRLYSVFSVTIRCMYKLHQTSCSRQMVWDRQDRNASSRPSASYKWGCILTATNQLKL